MTKPTGKLRDEMPHTASFIDALREAFGAAQINAVIKAGIDGAGTFHAAENGREIGSKPRAPGASFTVAELWIKPSKRKGGRA